MPKSSLLCSSLLNLNVIRWRELALLFLGILVGYIGIDLHHFERLMAEVPLKGKELATFKQKSDGIPMTAGMC